MHDLYKLKDMLVEEIKEFGRKGELTAGSLETVDTLAHAVKNLDKVIECEEDEEYSGDYRDSSYYGDGMSSNGRSYARGRGRNARRDSMGRYSSRYSRDGDMRSRLESLMMDADEETKRDLQRIVDRMR